MNLESLPNIEKPLPVTVTVFPDYLRGLYALMYFIDGLERNGQGMVPGSFELTMHYRQLVASILEAQRPDEPPF